VKRVKRGLSAPHKPPKSVKQWLTLYTHPGIHTLVYTTWYTRLPTTPWYIRLPTTPWGICTPSLPHPEVYAPLPTHPGVYDHLPTHPGVHTHHPGYTPYLPPWVYTLPTLGIPAYTPCWPSVLHHGGATWVAQRGGPGLKL